MSYNLQQNFQQLTVTVIIVLITLTAARQLNSQISDFQTEIFLALVRLRGGRGANYAGREETLEGGDKGVVCYLTSIKAFKPSGALCG